MKLSILVKFFEKILILDKIIRKSRFWSKLSTIPISVEIFEKSQWWSKLSKYLDFGQSFGKIAILVNIYEKSRLKLNFENEKNLDLRGNLKKNRLW